MSNPCSRCEGEGRIECPLEYGDDSHPENCPSCGGDDWIQCPDCEGSGQSDEDDE